MNHVILTLYVSKLAQISEWCPEKGKQKMDRSWLKGAWDTSHPYAYLSSSTGQHTEPMGLGLSPTTAKGRMGWEVQHTAFENKAK